MYQTDIYLYEKKIILTANICLIILKLVVKYKNKKQNNANVLFFLSILLIPKYIKISVNKL